MYRPSAAAPSAFLLNVRSPRNDFARTAPMILKRRKSLQINVGVLRFMGRVHETEAPEGKLTKEYGG